jgi:hypothetical protein
LGLVEEKTKMLVSWSFQDFFLFCLFLGGKKFHLIMHKQELAMFLRLEEV